MIPDNHVFVSYSHADAAWLERLRVHLRPLQRDALISLWDDTRIKAGSRWRVEIKESLDCARVAILLVSADFLASEFIATNELPPLLTAAEQRGTVILPVIVSPCRFEQIPSLACFQAINPPSQPLVGLRRAKRESIFVQLTRRIEDALTIPSKPSGIPNVGAPALASPTQGLTSFSQTQLQSTCETDIVFIGPRYSGKTSIITRWIAPWVDVRSIAATAGWTRAEMTMEEFEDGVVTTTRGEISRANAPTICVHLHDHPGETAFRSRAFQALHGLNPSVLICVMAAEYRDGQVLGVNRNKDYYSLELFREIVQSSGNFSRVIIVFNKSDTLPDGWDEERALEVLFEANSDAIDMLFRIFRSSEAELVATLTSAYTSKGIFELLITALTPVLPKTVDTNRTVRALKEWAATARP